MTMILTKDFSLSSSAELTVPVLFKKRASSFVQSASTDPFTIEWYMKMTDNADVNKDLESHFTLKDPRFHSEPSLIDYEVVFETFYKKHKVRSVWCDELVESLVLSLPGYSVQIKHELGQNMNYLQ